MDLAAFYFQAAEAAATVAVDVEAPALASRTTVLLKFDVQQAVALGAAGDAAARGRATLRLGAAAAVGVMEHDARAAFQGDHVCPECGKAFPSGKAMYGHLRTHPERKYKGKGSSRPSTPVASSASAPAAGDARPKKASSRKDQAPELLPTMKWPVTARRSRTPAVVGSPVSSEPAAVLLPEPARSSESAPSLLEPPRGVEPVPLQLDPPAVLLLEPARRTGKEEEEAAMTLLKLHNRMRGEAEAPPEPEDQLPMQQMHVDHNAVVAQQIPPVSQLELPADHVAPAATTHHAPVEHIFRIIVEPQAPDVEQSNVTAAAASKGKMPMEPEEHVNTGALVLFRDKSDKLASPGPSKRPRKRPLQDPDHQTQPPPHAADAAEEDRMPPLRRIPSPASDRRFVCPVAMCAKTFPTHQALGGHMASHNRAIRCAAAQNMDGLAAAHAVQNIMIHHQLRQDAALREDVVLPVPRAPKTHSCSRCDLIFPTGQALGGHMRKHWLEEKARAAPAPTALGVPTLDAMTPAAVPSAPVNALALAVPAAVPAAPANAMVLAVPIVPEPVEPAVPNGRLWEFDLNEMPME